jgi:hypothetical protein
MSIFKESFKKGVREQIEARQNAIEKHTPETIQYLNSRNAWVRMTSAVNVDEKDSLARYHILQGGMLYNNALRSGIGTSTQAYSTKAYGGVDHKFGMRPMPGITSVEIESDSAYGSIRRVTVNFNCWDIKQLEDLEILYMRPGYTALVEWGWAPYLNNAGKLENNIPSVDIFSSKTKEDIWKEIANKSTANGNYDAHYGFIKNYSWSARVDGGYDCSVIIVSIGEILESLKVNYNASTTSASSEGLFGILTPTPFNKDSPVSLGYNQNVLAGAVAEIYEIAIKNEIGDKAVTKVKLKDYEYSLFRFNVSVTPGKEDEVTSPFGNKGYQIYMRLGDFVELLNKYILLQDEKSGKPLIPVSVLDSEGKNLLCLGNELQISTDPTVCLIGNNGVADLVPDAKALQEITTALNGSSPYWNTPYSLAIIGNIYVNLEYIYKLATDSNLAAQDKKEKNDINAYDFLKNMMNGISAAIGNVATFDIFNDSYDGVARIIDINFTGDKEIAKRAFVLQIQNTKSIVRSYSLKSKIFPEQSTQIAIGAQAEGGALGTDSNTMSEFNKNLEDRILLKKTLPKALNEPVNNEDKLKNVVENFKVLMDYVSNLDVNSVQDWWSSQGDFNAGEATKYANALKDIINYTRTLTKDDTQNRAIIPTELSIEMDGIGGVIIGNIFKIPKDVLPRGYRGEGQGNPGPKDVAYVVTGLGHSIQNNDWITKIKGQLIILDTPSGSDLASAKKNARAKDKLINPKQIIQEIVQGNYIGTGTDTGTGVVGDGGGGTSERRQSKRCAKTKKIAPPEIIKTIPALPSWNSIKKTFPIINGPVPVYSVLSPGEGGDAAYKMINKRTDPRTVKVDYIVLHYTAGGTNGNPITPFSGVWNSVKASADFNISRNGKIAGFKNFLNNFSWHYGKAVTWGSGVNRKSIGIEIESYGPALYCPDENVFINTLDIPALLQPNEIAYCNKPYRGYNIFQCHTNVQISATANLIIALYNSGIIGDQTKFIQGVTGTNRYDILFPELPALKTAPPPGILTHGSGRTGKMDTFPQSNLIEMLDDLPNLLRTYKNSISWIDQAPSRTSSPSTKVTETTQTPTRQENINSTYCNLDKSNKVTGGFYKGVTWDKYKESQKVTPAEENIAKASCVDKSAKGDYKTIKYSSDLIYTTPNNSSPTSIAIVIGGIDYATAQWMLGQMPESLKNKKSFLFINYGTNNLKAAESKAKELGKTISSVSGFSRGGIEAFSVVNKYPFIGLIDPSLPTITKKTSNPTKAKMIYNPNNWGEYPNLRTNMIILGEIMGTNATKVATGHSNIPLEFFNKYGNQL